MKYHNLNIKFLELLPESTIIIGRNNDYFNICKTFMTSWNVNVVKYVILKNHYLKSSIFNVKYFCFHVLLTSIFHADSQFKISFHWYLEYYFSSNPAVFLFFVDKRYYVY
jgi:hypothetical protein